jgi:hypothetical protein
MWRNNENDSSSDNYQFFNVVMIPGFVLCSPLPAAFDRVLQVLYFLNCPAQFNINW